MNKNLDIVGIGNAIVDVLSQSEDSFLEQENLDKGAMILVDEEQAAELYAKMGPAIEVSGGSVANTIAALASLGSKTGFIGKIGSDQLGGVFQHDMQAMGVEFNTPALTDGPATAHCLVFITPDAQRTMCTFLGASNMIANADIDKELIKSAKILYLEGYLFDRQSAKKAFFTAAEIAKNTKTKVAISLSDSFCVERHREEFLELLENHIDILFANENEIKALFETDKLDDTIYNIKKICDIAVITKSAEGSIIVEPNKKYEIPAFPVKNIIDTTGAGDFYAAGFLHAYSKGHSLEICGKTASIIASEVITHMGARPQTDLAKLLADNLKI